MKSSHFINQKLGKRLNRRSRLLKARLKTQRIKKDASRKNPILRGTEPPR